MKNNNNKFPLVTAIKLQKVETAKKMLLSVNLNNHPHLLVFLRKTIKMQSEDLLERMLCLMGTDSNHELHTLLGDALEQNNKAILISLFNHGALTGTNLVMLERVVVWAISVT